MTDSGRTIACVILSGDRRNYGVSPAKKQVAATVLDSVVQTTLWFGPRWSNADQVMGKRLSKIYTRTGDDGTTGLGDGSRVAKNSRRVDAYGTIDEANSAIGVVLACDSVPQGIRTTLTDVQHDLFELGGELCIPGHCAVKDEFIERLERELDALNADLPALKEFVLPGGGQAAAACHLARTVVRRAERVTITLASTEDVRPEAIRYLNRLSDLLFVIARVLARADTGQEILWDRERS
jgi:cob(I)alamin adenosyltransferase